MIVKCTTEEEIEKLKRVAETSLTDNYIVEASKLKNRKVKIIGCTGQKTQEEIEKCIWSQNNWINSVNIFGC